MPCGIQLETVANIPLIVSSILSKKLAGGAETIIIDVKCGSGAFMQDVASASALASALEETGKRCGVDVRTEITDMSQPLGAAVGNAAEVAEALKVLRNQADTPPSCALRSFALDWPAEPSVPSTSTATQQKSCAPGRRSPRQRSGLPPKALQEWTRHAESLIETPILAPSDGFLARLDMVRLARRSSNSEEDANARTTPSTSKLAQPF